MPTKQANGVMSYTDADLKPRKPLTVSVEKEPFADVGLYDENSPEWNRFARRPDGSSVELDYEVDKARMLRETGYSTTDYRRPTIENELALMSSPEGQDAARNQSNRAAIAAERSLGFPETLQRYAEPLKRGLDVGAGIGSMIPGPHQPFAGAYTALRGGEEFVEDPSASNAAWAGLGALPFLKPLRGAMNEAKAAKAATKAAEYDRTGYGARGYAKNAQRAKPSEGGYTPNAGKPSPGARPTENPNWAAGEGTARVPRPAMQSQNPTGAVDDFMGNQRGLDAMHAGYEANNPIFREMAQAGTFGERNKGIPASLEALASKNNVYGATEGGGWRNISLDDLDDAGNMADDVIPESMQGLVDDWRFSPPPSGAKFNPVAEHAGQSQAELAQLLGVREGMMPAGTKITKIHKPLYPSGDSKTDKLVGAMRQREKVAGYKD